jgi:hypothetical protein
LRQCDLDAKWTPKRPSRAVWTPIRLLQSYGRLHADGSVAAEI